MEKINTISTGCESITCSAHFVCANCKVVGFNRKRVCKYGVILRIRKYLLRQGNGIVLYCFCSFSFTLIVSLICQILLLVTDNVTSILQHVSNLNSTYRHTQLGFIFKSN